ncbi:hypothetical protein LF1_36320 [Rubripirellula obstinata]|uniref:Uncharacterized protein n=1 Tax=Rubripirellula obstinata TaxID=406547 RepID=A0A5B1CJ15_9BACT|nr:hypothetical protein [Rubripirellula obstinata]KAA1261088.1 hypothetical protein LF1_36320 [Rubripirellula obstinata]
MAVEDYRGFRSPEGGRDISGYLCRKHTTATLSELSQRFGLGDPDSSSDMVERARKFVTANADAYQKSEANRRPTWTQTRKPNLPSLEALPFKRKILIHEKTGIEPFER